uniref:Uncharacterized protein n=1 Tax=Thaumatella adunca TaxID=2006976 RepID=A0A1Z1MMZ9_9FLOR|nr:hypothetical protein [Thaumatella adunca]ARW67418.1 hypothetical protein [Thaumatella adunca]
MVSDLKNIYHDKYENFNLSEDNYNEENTSDNIDMPTGWSFICLDETINYYADYNNRIFNSND